MLARPVLLLGQDVERAGQGACGADVLTGPRAVRQGHAARMQVAVRSAVERGLGPFHFHCLARARCCAQAAAGAARPVDGGQVVIHGRQAPYQRQRVASLLLVGGPFQTLAVDDAQSAALAPDDALLRQSPQRPADDVAHGADARGDRRLGPALLGRHVLRVLQAETRSLARTLYGARSRPCG